MACEVCGGVDVHRNVSQVGPDKGFDGKPILTSTPCPKTEGGRFDKMPVKPWREIREVRVTDPTTGGQKGVKPERYDLFPFDALDEVARVYAFGATKYANDNWLKGYAWRLSAGALMRHVSRFMCGEDRDPETGCLHLAHAAWHCLTLITFAKRKLGTDDRAKIEEAPDYDPPRSGAV